MTPVAELQRSYSPAEVQAMVDEAQREAEVFVADNDIIVVDVVTLQQAARVRQGIGQKLKAIELDIAKPKSWAAGIHKWICGLEKSAGAKYRALDVRLVERIRVFKAEEDERRIARERALSAQIKKETDDRAITTAQHLQNSGQTALAKQVIDQAAATPAQSVSLQDDTRVVGQSWVRRWKWRFTLDTPEAEHLAVVGKGPSLREAVERLLDRIPDQALLDALGPALEAEQQLVAREFLCLDRSKVGGLVSDMKAAASKLFPACISVFFVDDPVRR